MRGGAKGDFIGRGIQGAVQENDDKMVVKVMHDITAFRKEKRVAEELKKIDPDQEYTLYGTEFTEGAVYRVRMPHGGITIENIYNFLENAQDKSSNNATIKSLLEEQFAGDELSKIKASLKRLKAFLPRLHAAGIVHDDIHMANLLWDGERLRLIDWGQSVFIDNDVEHLDNSLELLFKTAEIVKKKFHVGSKTRNTKNERLINLFHGIY